MDQQIISEIVREFKITPDLKLAGYILGDGRLLKLSSNDKYRDLDHMEVGRFLRGRADLDSKDEESSYPYLEEFVKMGNIRINGECGEIMIGKLPTLSQAKVLDYIFVINKGKVYMDLISNQSNSASKSYLEGTNPKEIHGDIYKYYNKGIVPRMGI